MTNRQTFQINQHDVVVSLDNPVPVGRRAWTLIRARLVDETTGLAPPVGVTIEADEPNLTPRVALGGLVGFAGYPEEAFPQLNTSNYIVHMTLRAPGFLEDTRQVTVPLNPLFPATFVPVDLGLIPLRREPVTVRGRVTRPAPLGPVPVGGATVIVTGIWRMPPPAAAPPPPAAANLVFLQPGAVLPRSAATGNVHRRDLTAAGSDKMLMEEAVEGASTVRISDRVGTLAGDILALDPEDAGRSDFVTVAGIDGGALNEAATITLSVPLARRHRRDSLVQLMNAALVGPNNLLTDDIAPGDTTVLLASTTGLTGATHVEIADGVAADELQSVQLYEAVTAADGFYQLPPINRMAQIQITANDGVNPAVDTVLRLDYANTENRHDITIL